MQQLCASRVSHFCLVSFAFLGIHGPLSAATLIASANTGAGASGIGTPPPGQQEFHYSATFPQFNPDLGTLQAINTRFDAALTADWIFLNPSEELGGFWLTASSLSQLAPNVGLFGPGPSINKAAPILPMQYYMGTAFDNGTNSFAVSRTTSPYFDLFIGHGSMLLEGSALFTSTYADFGMVGEWSYNSHISLRVEYIYEVPEPATFAPVMLGLGLLCGLGRMRLFGRGAWQ